MGIAAIVVFLEAKKEKIKDAEGKYFYPKICVIILAILLIGIIFTAMGSSSQLFLLACTDILVDASKLLERMQAKSASCKGRGFNKESESENQRMEELLFHQEKRKVDEG